MFIDISNQDKTMKFEKGFQLPIFAFIAHTGIVEIVV